MKKRFDDFTVGEMLALVKEKHPDFALDISCFMNELYKEQEVLEANLEDVLTGYDCDLEREARDININFLASIFYNELIAAVKKIAPNETWTLVGEQVLSTSYPNKIEKWELYTLEKHKAQFATIGYKKMIEVYFDYKANHKTDGIDIIDVVIVKE